MSTVTMTLSGVEGLRAALVRNPEVVRTHMGGVIHATAFSVAQRARAFVPVATGALKASITATARGLSGQVGVGATMIAGQRPELYWRFVEYGTVRMAARPVFRSAAEAETPILESRIRGIVPAIERDFSLGRAA